jgi:hypothetical protein
MIETKKTTGILQPGFIKIENNNNIKGKDSKENALLVLVKIKSKKDTINIEDNQYFFDQMIKIVYKCRFYLDGTISR